MRREINPWPALSDLFAGLLVATFGGLMLYTGAATKEDPVDARARTISQHVLKSLQQSIPGKSREVGGDTFLDVHLNFELNKDDILPDDRARVQSACQALKHLFDTQQVRPEELEIWIEGHSDVTQAQRVSDPRNRFLFNWRLSSSRASSVLYEFRSCGLEPTRASKQRIFAIGYADTRPIPGETSNDVQRRTTFRIRPDRCAIRALQRGKPVESECTPF